MKYEFVFYITLGCSLSTLPPPTTPKNETGFLLSLALVGLLVALLVAVLAVGVNSGPIQPGPRGILLGLYIMVWGCMFLASYYFSHKSFFLRGLVWICEHISYPASRKMAFFYFLLAFGVGTMALLAGMGIV